MRSLLDSDGKVVRGGSVDEQMWTNRRNVRILADASSSREMPSGKAGRYPAVQRLERLATQTSPLVYAINELLRDGGDYYRQREKRSSPPPWRYAAHSITALAPRDMLAMATLSEILSPSTRASSCIVT